MTQVALCVNDISTVSYSLLEGPSLLVKCMTAYIAKVWDHRSQTSISMDGLTIFMFLPVMRTDNNLQTLSLNYKSDWQ